MDTDKLKKQLYKHEGVRFSAYQDSLGYLTIGVGHLIDARLGGRLYPQVVDLQLELDIAERVKEAQTYSWFDSLSDCRQNVVLNILFNLGKLRFDKFVKFQQAVIQKNWEQAARQLESSLWAQQVKTRAVELIKQWRDDTWLS